MFYERLTNLCKQHNTTVSVFVRDVLKLNSSSATGWKKGATPRADVVLETARYFGVSTDYLLGNTDSPTLWISDIATLYKDRSEITTVAEAALNVEMQRLDQIETQRSLADLDHPDSQEDTKRISAIVKAYCMLPQQVRPHATTAILAMIESICVASDINA